MESLFVSLSLKYIVHSYEWRVEQVSASLYFVPVPEEIVYYFLVYFVIVQTWSIHHSLDKKVWLWIMFLPVKESHSVPDMDFFCYTFTFFVRFGVIKNRATKVNSKYFNGNFDNFICPVWSVLFLHAPDYQAWLFQEFIFELDASSYSFKITCILLRQVIYLNKMVVSTAKSAILISWSPPICAPLILLLSLKKLASASVFV